MHREELLRMVEEWPLQQLVDYINQLRERVVDTETLIKELNQIKRRKSRKSPVDNGVRGGL